PDSGKLFEFRRRGDRLLVTSLDRLSRDPADLLRILAVFADAGVILHVLEPRGQVCDIEVGTLRMTRDGLRRLGIQPNTDAQRRHGGRPADSEPNASRIATSSGHGVLARGLQGTARESSEESCVITRRLRGCRRFTVPSPLVPRLYSPGT